MGYEDFRGSSGDSSMAAGGTASSAGSATIDADAGNGGAGGGNGEASTGGTTGADAESVNCATVDVRATLSRVPLCTFPPPANQFETWDCQSSPVSVYKQQTVTFLASSDVLQCAEGPMASVALGQVGQAYRNSKEETVSGQVLAKGLVRLTCTSESSEGYIGTYNVTCSTNGLQIIQPYAKANVLYVEFPEGEVVPAGYEGWLGPYLACSIDGPGCAANIVYTSKSADNASLGTQTVTHSSDGRTFWFNDLSGRQVTISINDKYEVIDVER